MNHGHVDTAAEPLIPRSEEPPASEVREDDQTWISSGGADYDQQPQFDEGSQLSPGLFIWTLTLCAGISGLLFGYDTGVISSTLVSIDADLSSRPLNTLDKSLITSSTSLLALIASPLTGLLADTLGRKRIILCADILFILGALWQAYTSSVWGMIAGRSMVGAAVGSASFVVPLYISEVSPSPFRGRLVTVASLFITGGQVAAYIVGWIFSGTPGGWRWMVGLGALPAAVQLLVMGKLPETPRWLVRAGKTDMARRVLTRVYSSGDLGEDDVERLVGAVLRGVERELVDEETALEHQKIAAQSQTRSQGKTKIYMMSNTFSLLINVGGNRRALIIACMLQGFQQLCGFNCLMYFSGTILSLIGFRSPTLTSLSIASTNFFMTLVAFHSIDRVGRRRILLLSIPIMIIGLALCSMAFHFLDLPNEKASAVNMARGQGEGPQTWAVIVLLAMIIYVAGYAVGMGNVPWQQSELFPLSVRASGSSLATATNWASNFLVGITFLPMMAWLTPAGTFALYALVCCVGWGTIWRIYPETAGLGLEDVGSLLSSGWGVQESLEKWESRKRSVRAPDRGTGVGVHTHGHD